MFSIGSGQGIKNKTFFYTFVIVFILGYLFLIIYPKVDAKKDSARNFFMKIPAHEIKEIRIESKSTFFKNRGYRVFDKQETILKIINSFENIKDFNPSNPEVKWHAIIRIKMKNGEEYGGEIKVTKNQGTLFNILSDVDSGWIYGQYRQDEIGFVLEKILQSRELREVD